MCAEVAGEIHTGWPHSLQGNFEQPGTGGLGIINTLKQRTTISSSSFDFSPFGFDGFAFFLAIPASVDSSIGLDRPLNPPAQIS